MVTLVPIGPDVGVNDVIVAVVEAAVTVIVPLVPVMLDVTVSVAVIVWLPAAFSVALDVPAPLISVVFAGNPAAVSVDEKWTVPA